MNQWEWHLLEDKTSLEDVEVGGVKVRVGDRVRLRPRQGGDILDIALQGQSAIVEGIEQDYEGKVHFAVVLDDDPGRDLGLLRQPGHRFFFASEEIEPLPQSETQPPKAAQQPSILIAGIGNIFLGDDGFGVEVVKRLATRSLPVSVRVADFGIRGFDLAYALMDGYDTTILVDSCSRRHAPGTVYVIEPDLSEAKAGDEESGLDAHGMDPMNVIRLALRMNAKVKRLLLVGCEPLTLGGGDGYIGLSRPVAAALDEAVTVIENLVSRLRDGSWESLEQGTAHNSGN